WSDDPQSLAALLRWLWLPYYGRKFFSIFFFFNNTATTDIYTLSLHGALPISGHLLEAVDVGPIRARRIHFAGQSGEHGPDAVPFHAGACNRVRHVTGQTIPCVHPRQAGSGL